MASKDNPIRKIFELRPMIRPIESANERLGRCVLEKTEKSIGIDLKQIFIVIGKQTCYVVAILVGALKSDCAWFSSNPIYVENLHIYHVFENEGYLDHV